MPAFSHQEDRSAINTNSRSARRWLRWSFVLALGVILGLLQLLLYFQSPALDQWSNSQLTAIALSALLYLLLPLLAGFLTSRQSEHLSAGMDAGCLVGSIGFLVTAVSISLILASLPSPCLGGTDGAALSCGGFVSLGKAIVFATLLTEGIGGFVGGLIGGGVGSILGESRIRQKGAGK